MSNIITFMTVSLDLDHWWQTCRHGYLQVSTSHFSSLFSFCRRIHSRAVVPFNLSFPCSCLSCLYLKEHCHDILSCLFLFSFNKDPTQLKNTGMHQSTLYDLLKYLFLLTSFGFNTQEVHLSWHYIHRLASFLWSSWQSHASKAPKIRHSMLVYLIYLVN